MTASYENLLFWSCILLSATLELAHAGSCDSNCQEEQLTAVQGLFDELRVSPVPVATAPVQSPIYCSWRGITCCTSSSTLDLTQGFPSRLPVQCVVPLGVAAVLLPAANLTGSIPDQKIWQPLASSLEYIDFAGERVCQASDKSSPLLAVFAVHEQLCIPYTGRPSIMLGLPALDPWLPHRATNTGCCLVAGNALTGTIPASLGLLSQLKILRLNENKLQGSIPPEVTQNCTLMLNLVLVSVAACVLRAERAVTLL